MTPKRRYCETDRMRATDRDFYFLIVRKSDGLRIKHKATPALREAMKIQSAALFEKIMDDAIERDNRKKHLVKKNEAELDKIRAAAAKGVPIESRIVQPDPKKPPMKVVRVMPWYRRLRRWWRHLWGIDKKVAVVKSD